MKRRHSDWMLEAMREAAVAAALGEVPVGCVIVKDDVVIARGHNTRETQQTALGHAELNALAEACRQLQSWRLSGCTLYVTLEPCPMCTGAILNSRLDRIVFGSWDSRAGCCGSLLDFTHLGIYPPTEILGGIQEIGCNKLLADFFQNLRSDSSSAHL